MSECSCEPTGSYCFGKSKFHVGQEVEYRGERLRVRAVLYTSEWNYCLDVPDREHSVVPFQNVEISGLKPTGLWYHVNDLIENQIFLMRSSKELILMMRD